MSKHDLEKQFKTQRLGKGGSTYGKRLDKTEKERGYLGEIRMPNQRDVMTEMSVGEPNSDELFRPAIIPGMHPADINFIRELDKVPEDVLATSLRHAKKRIKEGKSPFWNARQDLERQFINEDAIPHMGKGGKPKALGLAEEAAKLYTQAEKEIALEKFRTGQRMSKAENEALGLYHEIGGGPKLKKPKEEYTFETRLDPRFETATRRILSPEDLLGKVGIPLLGDRARAGHILQSVEGRALADEIPLEGGPEFMMHHPYLWASDKAVINKLAKQAKIAAQTGKEVLGINVVGSPTNVDFNKMVSGVLFDNLDVSSLRKKDIKDFNNEMRKVFPEFLGLEHPEVKEQMFGPNMGTLRTSFVKIMNKDKYQSAGFPDVAAARIAITEPKLIDVPTGSSGFTIGKFDPENLMIENPEIPHGTYPVKTGGEYVGGFEAPMDFRDVFTDFSDARRRFTEDPTRDLRSLSFQSPAIQEFDQEWLERIMPTYEQILKSKRYAKGGKVGKAAKALEELNKLYKQAEAEKKAEKVVKAPQIITRSGIADVKKEVANRKGAYAGRRVEHAADLVPNLEQQYTQNALIRGFTGDGDNATGMMVMNPRAFENYAEPIPEDYVNPEYIKELSDVARDSGFADVPFLELHRDAETGELKFSGHEGRHRTRALTDLGDESTIVRMLPRYSMREHLPRMSQEEYINALIDELGLDPLVRPQPSEEGSRRLMMLPTIFKDGGRASLEDEFIQANAINMADGGDIIVKGNPYGKGSGRPVHGKMKGPDWEVVKRAGELGAKQLKKEFTQDTPKQTAIDIAGNFIADTLGMPADIATSRPTPIKSKATPWGNIDFSKSKVIEPKEETHPVFGSETMKRIMKEQGITTGTERPLTEGLLTLATPAVVGKAPKIAKGVGKAVEALEGLPAGMSIKDVSQGAQFVSPLEKTIKGHKNESMPGNQWSAWLNANAPRGAKKEAEASGLHDWLKTQGKVSKSEIEAFLGENRPQVRVVEKGAPLKLTDSEQQELKDLTTLLSNEWHGGEPLTEEQMNRVMYLTNIEEKATPLNLRHQADQWEHRAKVHQKAGHDMTSKAAFARSEYLNNRADQLELNPLQYGGSKFENYTLPGGKNYQETMLTLPFKEPAMPKGYKVTSMDYGNGDIGYFAETPTTRSQRFSNEQDANEELQRMIGGLKDFRKNLDSFKVPGAHAYGDEDADINRVAHLRTKERPTADNKRALFLEELQSDWAQKGRDQGFKRDMTSDEMERLSQLDEKRKQLFQEQRELADKYSSPFVSLSDSRAIDERYNQTQQELMDIDREKSALEALRSNTTPSGPYVTDTKDWTALGLKHALKKAVDEGHDYLAWTTGEQQADRYSLATYLDNVRATKNADGTYSFSAYEKGANRDNLPTIRQDGLTENELSDHLGKDMARKIVDDLSEAKPSQVANYNNLDLQIGGEGMIGYYDKIMPQVMNDVLKQYGVKDGVKPIGIKLGENADKTISNYQVHGNGMVTLEVDGDKRIFHNEEHAQNFLNALDNAAFPQHMSADELLEAHGHNMSGEQKKYLRDFSNRWEYADDMGRDLDELTNEYQDWLSTQAFPNKGVSTHMGVEITPELREKILSEGLPHFKKGGKITKSNLNDEFNINRYMR